jgi:hypothetical protein
VTTTHYDKTQIRTGRDAESQNRSGIARNNDSYDNNANRDLSNEKDHAQASTQSLVGYELLWR